RELKNVAERLVVGARSGRVETTSLPSDVSSRGTQSTPRSDVAMTASSNIVSASMPTVAFNLSVPATSATLQQRLDRLMKDRVSFWSEVHEPFMNHDITREAARHLVRQGLAHTRGNYKMLVRAFNMDPRDYKRFLSFLRTYECHVSFRPFRMMGACAENTNAPMAGA